jgi:hypothetical protein
MTWAIAICSVGFVVGEATAPTVPFRPELAGSPHVACTAELLTLLGSICRTDQWHSAAEESRVLARWPNTAINRLQSYNFQDRYIRHYAYQLKLDPITTATGRSDATFRVTS